MISDVVKVMNYFARKDYDDKVHYFDDLLRAAIHIVLDKNGDDLDRFVDIHSNRYWNALNQQQNIDREKGIVPLFNIEDELSKKISWFIRTSDKKLIRRLHLLRSRTHILRKIDSLNSRQYEALACVTCCLLGASNVLLTTTGNEAGIDFLASINFSADSHYFFGVNGPLRIIGQCKKHNSAIQVGSIKEFNSTLDDVYSLTEKVRKILPSWFLTSKGPIIAWFICHSGFQSGALSRARNYGIITSDSRDLAEVISSCRRLKPLLPYDMRVEALTKKVTEILNDANINMDL